MEKRGDVNPGYTPPEQAVPPSPSPPPLAKHGQAADDVRPTAAELRAELERGPQKRLADRAADRLR